MKDEDIIWIPNIVFENSQSGTFTKNEPMSVLRVQQKGEAKSNFNFILNEFEEFEGNSNPLIYENKYELELHCDFELHYYPFDCQKCYIMVIFKNIFFY